MSVSVCVCMCLFICQCVCVCVCPWIIVTADIICVGMENLSPQVHVD